MYIYIQNGCSKPSGYRCYIYVYVSLPAPPPAPPSQERLAANGALDARTAAAYAAATAANLGLLAEQRGDTLRALGCYINVAVLR